VRLLRDHPGLDAGAHLAIVGEDPPLLTAAEVPTLVNRRGRFPLTYRTVVARAAAGRVDPDDIRRELRAQLDRIRDAGVHVTHANCHQHLHLWPAIGVVVAELAAQDNIPSVRAPTSRSRGPVGLTVRRLSGRLRGQLEGAGLHCTAGYAGLDEAGRMNPARLARAVSAVAAEGIGEITVHPGEPDDPARARFQWHYQWEGELDMLTDQRTRQMLRDHDVELASFRDVNGAGR